MLPSEGPAFLKEHIEPKVEEALNAAGFVSQSKYNALKNIATKLEARIDELEKKGTNPSIACSFILLD